MDGRVYAIGGRAAWLQALATVEVYTPGTRTWTTVAPMPTPRYGLGGTIGPGGHIFAVGGTNTTDPNDLGVAEAYTP